MIFCHGQTRTDTDKGESHLLLSVSVRVCPWLIFLPLVCGVGRDASAIPSRGSKVDRAQPWDEGSRTPLPLPTVVKPARIFGIGVGFEKTGILAGVPLTVVLPGSPAERAGLVPGCVIVEINGHATVGRRGEDCANIIREALGIVRLKYLDAGMKERVLNLDKEWIDLPE